MPPRKSGCAAQAIRKRFKEKTITGQETNISLAGKASLL
jgi:hypothetical protein